MGPTLTLTIQNLTHHDVSADMRDVNVNGAMINTGALFSIAAGKEQTSDCYLMWENLKDAGITEAEEIKDITFSVNISDAQTYQKLASLGPFYVAIDESGNVVNRVVYTDRETIREVQSLLNAAGYDVGSADGIAGKKTNNMILQYERDHGLPEDTDITDELLDALRKG